MSSIFSKIVDGDIPAFKVAEDENSFLTVPEIRKSIDEYRENTGEPPYHTIEAIFYNKNY